MGLSGRKEKQRIGADPRNLAWADDAAKFGSSYLSKFGWDSSKGLGVEGEGRISHIKVSQKLDLFGIGAAQQKDPNGIAWKQNKDFERLLERLNATAEAESVKNEEEGEEKPNQEDATEKKKRKKSEPMPVEAAKPLVPRHRAHRARAIAAKNMASKSAISVSEILGIAPTPSTGASTTPEGTLTPFEDVVHEKLTTSTKSVADYFKDKLLAKAGKSETATPTPEIKPEMDYEDAPRGGLGSSRVKIEFTEDVVDSQPRTGLSATLASSFFAATSISVEVKEEEVQIDDVKAQKKKRSSTEETESRKRKDKKGKRRRDEEAESAAATAMEDDASEKRKKRRRRDEESEPAATPEDASEKKKKKRRRRDEESASAYQEEGDVKVELVDEDERKKAKKERKRLKALKKEGIVA